MDQKRWSLREKIAGLSVVGAACVFIVSAAITGIIGDQANQIVTSLWEGFRALDAWPWILTLTIVVIGFGFILFFAGSRNRVLRRERDHMKLEWQKIKSALDNTSFLLLLDGTFLRLLANWMSASNREKEMKKLLEKLLRDATRLFEREVHRAIIFCPDATGKLLKPWANHQMPPKTISRTRFPIGKNGGERKRGFAGTVFIERKIHVAHIKHESDQWSCDADCYMDFDKERPFPPYSSLIGIPLIASELDSPVVDAATTCFGVVCFDSQHPTFFDNPGVVELLRIVAQRIAVALLIYNQVQQSNNL